MALETVTPINVRLEACLRGIAVGDSLGLPMEGLSARRSSRLFPNPLRQRLIGSKGMLSDDTLMAVCTVQAFYAEPTDSDRFARELARHLRRWFWTIPPGIGLATARACLRLTVGVSPEKSGVNSAGNGALIRAVALGAIFADEPERARAFIDASTRITHVHPTAQMGAQIAGFATREAVHGRLGDIGDVVGWEFPDWPRTEGYIVGKVSGYVVSTLNAVLDCLATYPNEPNRAVERAIELGGDTDSVAALAGGIGAVGRPEFAFPEHWMRWTGWPLPNDLRGVAIGERTKFPTARLRMHNALGLAIVLGHGFRRMLPPY